MICETCSKLLIKEDLKKCRKCKNDVFDNLSLICNTCSSNEIICSICLKKTYDSLTNKRKTLGSGGCRSCGRK